MRELARMHHNLLPRLRGLSEQLGRNGAVVEAWEMQSIQTYFDLKLRAAYDEIDRDCQTINQLTIGLPAVRTTPLFYATDEELHTS
jgi:hypothetical protein